MGCHRRVINLTNGFRLKPQHAARAVLNCAAAWVVCGISVRSLTLQESISARNEQAKLREPLPYAEVYDLRFDPPVSGISATRYEGILVREAHLFCMGEA